MPNLPYYDNFTDGNGFKRTKLVVDMFSCAPNGVEIWKTNTDGSVTGITITSPTLTTPVVSGTLYLGGTTSLFPAIRRSGNAAEFIAGDASAYAPITASAYNLGSPGTAPIANNVLPTLTGFGTSPTIVGNGSISFIINVGTGGVATSGTITFNGAVANGWMVMCNNLTAAAAHNGQQTRVISNTTSAVTIENQSSAGAATAWAAGSLIHCLAVPC